jgi:hypothetical protein
MNSELIQPAATLAATLLHRLAQQKDLSTAEITSAFLHAMESLEDAADRIAKGDGWRAKPRQIPGR